MVEPVGITLAAAGLLYPIYQACDDLYHGYKLTRSFGDDFDLVQLELEMQYSRLEKTSETRDVELHGLDRPSDINNSNHRVTSIVVRTLSQIKVQFELANKLLGKYDETEREHDSNTQILDTAGTSEEVTLQSSQSTSDATLPSSTSDVPATVSSSTKRRKPKTSNKNRFLGVLGLGKMHKNAIAPEGASHSTLAVRNPAATALLNADAVVTADMQRAKDCQHYSHKTSFFKKAGWAKEDKKTLLRIIKVLNLSNNYIETILVLKTPRDMERLVNLPGDDTAWLREARAVQRSLKRLHESLRHMNTPSGEHGPWYLCLQLIKDFGEHRQYVVDNLTDLPLRDEQQYKAYYFSFQRQQSPDAKASYFIAETMPEYLPGSKVPERPGESALHLDQAKSLAKTVPIEGFKKWGTVWIGSRKNDVHWLYHAEAQQTVCIADLVALLRAHDTQAYMAAYRRVGLAALVAKSYLHLGLVRSSCAEIQPSSFRYFGKAGEEKQWNHTNPLILDPYLEIGFGRRLDGDFGTRSGVSQSQNGYIVGLGLLLYQIGCCLALDYTQDTSELREAQKIASADLHQLDLVASPRFAEIVQGCLQYPAAGAGGNFESESRFVEGVVSELFQLQADLQ